MVNRKSNKSPKKVSKRISDDLHRGSTKASDEWKEVEPDEVEGFKVVSDTKIKDWNCVRYVPDSRTWVLTENSDFTTPYRNSDVEFAIATEFGQNLGAGSTSKMVRINTRQSV